MGKGRDVGAEFGGVVVGAGRDGSRPDMKAAREGEHSGLLQ